MISKALISDDELEFFREKAIDFYNTMYVGMGSVSFKGFKIKPIYMFLES